MTTLFGDLIKKYGGTVLGSYGYGISPSPPGRLTARRTRPSAGLKVGVLNTSVPFGGTDFGPAALTAKQKGVNVLTPEWTTTRTLRCHRPQAARGEDQDRPLPDRLRALRGQLPVLVGSCKALLPFRIPPSPIRTPGPSRWLTPCRSTRTVHQTDFPTFNV